MKKNKKQIEATGKVETYEPTTLDQICGFNELARYGTMEQEQYSARLNDMTRTDLEAHARKMGVVIVEGTERLKGKLLSEFQSYVAMLRKPPTPPKQSVNIDPAVLKILAQGR